MKNLSATYSDLVAVSPWEWCAACRPQQSAQIVKQFQVWGSHLKKTRSDGLYNVHFLIWAYVVKRQKKEGSKLFTDVAACGWWLNRWRPCDGESWSRCGGRSVYLLSLGPLMWTARCGVFYSRNNVVWCGGCTDISVIVRLILTEGVWGLGSSLMYTWFASKMKDER